MGYNKEFEQIKDFEEGDEIKSINWKASARRHKLMVNQYQDERAQHIYCAIDMGRSMKMPFNEMTLLDYAINASLTLSQVVLKNNDRIGLITYADTIHSVVPSDRKNTQLTQILETLYNQETQFNESGLIRFIPLSNGRSTTEPVYIFLPIMRVFTASKGSCPLLSSFHAATWCSSLVLSIPRWKRSPRNRLAIFPPSTAKPLLKSSCLKSHVL
ncbi:MAG: DUF58 domain-containing protein [Bacteroidales bacterium]